MCIEAKKILEMLHALEVVKFLYRDKIEMVIKKLSKDHLKRPKRFF